MIMQPIYDLELHTIENAISLEKHDNILNVKEMKVNIPKIMPLIDVDKPKSESIFINDMLENDVNCKPQFSNEIKSVNYINTTYPKIALYPEPIDYGDTVTCIIKNLNIKDIKFAII